ncbi:MAG: wax ester/triacylglycerol synthase family O-acyltransferase [Actinomycetota bacterium]
MPQRLSALDVQFLLLEQPSVHFHVAGLSVLDPSTRPGGPDGLYEDVKKLFLERRHLIPRFRQKIMPVPFGAGRPVWVDDPDFDLDFHFRRGAVPRPGGKKELADYVQRIHSRPLDRSKSLWEMYFIEGLEDDHVAVLSKVHHAMIDGMSGMDIATVLFDLGPEPRVVEPEPFKPEPAPSPRDLLVDSLREGVTHPIKSAFGNLSLAVRAPEIILRRVQQTVSGLGSILAAGSPPKSPFNRPVGPNRRFAMVEAPVSDYKAIKNALGGTVNDVVLATVAGALHRFLKRRGEPTQGLALRAMIPVSTRDESQKMALGNQVTSIFVDLPVGPMDAATRLRSISAATKDLKESHQAVAAGALMNIGTWAPPTLHGLAARAVARRRFVNLVISNVPGPQIPIYLAGAKLLATYPVMPLGETLALAVAVTSLAGTMAFGITSDWDSMPDIDDFATDMSNAILELKKAAGE